MGLENTFVKKEKLMAEMMEEFKQYDVNGDGFVTRDEIHEVMEKNADKWGLFDFGFFEDLDENNDGKISLEGKIAKKHENPDEIMFRNWISEWTREAVAELDFIEIGLSAALKELSEDKDGKISLDEIKKAYENRGRKFTAEDQKIFEKLDKDDSEKIDIEGKIDKIGFKNQLLELYIFQSFAR